MNINVGRLQHATEEKTLREVQRATEENREISDAAAMTIASWYASPGTRGSHLAQLSSTGTADLEDLLEDISYEYREVGQRSDKRERIEQLRCLDMLSTWAVRHVNDKEN